MADPFTLAGASMAATALGGGVSAFGALGKGNAQGAAYDYQAGVADLNKKINLQNADYERTVGEQKAFQSGLKTMFTTGTQKVNQGASGLDVNSGSAVAVRDSTNKIGYMDQTTIRANAARTAYGYDVKAAENDAEASMDRSAAENSRTSGKIGAVASLISTAGSVAGKWYQGNSVGLVGGDSGGGKGDFTPSVESTKDQSRYYS